MVYSESSSDIWEVVSALLSLKVAVVNDRAAGACSAQGCTDNDMRLEDYLRFHEDAATDTPAYKNRALPMPLRKLADTMKPGVYWRSTQSRRRATIRLDPVPTLNPVTLVGCIAT